MKKFLVGFVLLLAACSNGGGQVNEATETIIEWVDFIKINGQQYGALYTTAITDEKYIGDKLGEVEFKVNDVIDDPHYTIKDGDAAFWEEGTVIYEVKGKPDFAAIPDQNEINGYRLYQKEEVDEKWSFDHVNKDSITKIEIMEGIMNPQLVHTLTDESEIEELLNLLENSQERENLNQAEEDPDVYDVVFYSDDPIASYYPIFHNNTEWYWLPWEEEILSDAIEKYIE